MGTNCNLLCGFLWFTAVICENHKFSAKICASLQMLPRGEGKATKICEEAKKVLLFFLMGFQR